MLQPESIYHEIVSHLRATCRNMNNNKNIRILGECPLIAVLLCLIYDECISTNQISNNAAIKPSETVSS